MNVSHILVHEANNSTTNVNEEEDAEGGSMDLLKLYDDATEIMVMRTWSSRRKRT